ncbi:MAG: hypothetical protein WCO91_03880 [Gemmataceae bacterium]
MGDRCKLLPSRHTKCACFVRFLPWEYSRHEAGQYNGFVRSQIDDILPHRGAKVVGTLRRTIREQTSTRLGFEWCLEAP